MQTPWFDQTVFFSAWDQDLLCSDEKVRFPLWPSEVQLWGKRTGPIKAIKPLVLLQVICLFLALLKGPLKKALILETVDMDT